MKFNYQARTKDGQIQRGIIEASSEEAALTILQKYGLYVTFLEKIQAQPVYAKQIKLFQKASQKDVVIFSRQLSIMFRSQVPIVEALLVISRQAANPDFREKILKLSEEVEGGTTLSAALSLFPKLFSSFFINMVKSGEASGKLAESLDYLADHLEKEYNFKNKIRGAMLYPAVVLFIFLAVLILMIFFVIPSLTDVLKETGQELPSVTKSVMAMTDFLRNWMWVVILAFFGLIIFIFRYFKTKEGKKTLDRFSLKLPLIGSLLRKIYLTRLAENLSTLISGGLPIARALEISGEVVGNDIYKSIIFRTRDEVRKGEFISAVLEDYPEEFPPLFIQMAVVGEKTGRLESSLTNIVNFYQKDVDRSIDNLINLLEPIMIIFLALLTAGLLGSVLLPMYQIGMGGY